MEFSVLENNHMRNAHEGRMDDNKACLINYTPSKRATLAFKRLYAIYRDTATRSCFTRGGSRNSPC